MEAFEHVKQPWGHFIMYTETSLIYLVVQVPVNPNPKLSSRSLEVCLIIVEGSISWNWLYPIDIDGYWGPSTL